jgi:prepilin-type processing-associated H-X9-DG protein
MTCERPITAALWPTARRRGRPSPVAFTLVELLVVIGIIALLIAIILPVMGGVRRQSQVVRCQSNLKQLFTACQTFTIDQNGERSPCPSLIGEYRTDPDVVRGCVWAMDVSGQPGVADLQYGVVWKYIGNDQVRRSLIFCPADDAELQLTANNKPSPNRNFSYSFNGYMKQKDELGRRKGTPILLVKKPTDKIMIWEEVGPNDSYCVNPASGIDDRPSGRHGKIGALQYGSSGYGSAGRGNFCFFDGHVEALSPDQIVANINTYYCPLQ